MAPAKIRLSELDGLRGWAALSVVVFHIFWECFGELFPQVRNLVTAALLNGHFAVCVFFVISGAALSAPFFAGGGHRYVLSATTKRYVRLTLPIVVFTTLFFLLARAGLVTSNEAALVLQREDWGGLASNASPGVVDTVLFMFRDVYLGATGDRDVMPFLWTMPVEMLGSMLLFLFMAIFDVMPNQQRSFALLTALVFLVNPLLGAFFLGAMLSRNRISGRDWGFFRRHDTACTLLALAVVFLVSGGMRMIHMPILFENVISVLNATLLVYVSLHGRGLKRFLGRGNPVSHFLGQISFTIYILHYIVITTLLSGLVLRFRDTLDLPTAMAIATVTLVACLGLSWLTLFVDRRSHRFSQVVGRWILGPDQARTPPLRAAPPPAAADPALEPERAG